MWVLTWLYAMVLYFGRHGWPLRESQCLARWKFFVQPFNIIELYTIETQGETNIDLENLWFPYENLVQMLGFPQLCEFRRDFYGHESTPTPCSVTMYPDLKDMSIRIRTHPAVPICPLSYIWSIQSVYVHTYLHCKCL